MGALDAHTAMSRQALNSATVQSGMKDILLNYAGLWEALRERASGPAGGRGEGMTAS
jgi:type I restriction enzyme, R subunit